MTVMIIINYHSFLKISDYWLRGHGIGIVIVGGIGEAPIEN